MKQIGTVKIHCISEAMSPITHMMGTAGNEAIINREQILHENIVKKIPVLSGNALRHKLVREPGVLYLVKQLDLYGELSIDQANYLFNGGSLTESSSNENMKTIAKMQTLFPLLRLLGGSLRNQVIGGSLFVQRGLLICEENIKTIGKHLPSDYHIPDNKLYSAEHFVSNYQYTRGDADKRKDAAEIIKDHKAKEKSNLMIYNGQSIIPGSLFYHGFTLYNVSPLEIGALLHALQIWQNTDGVIGGSARIGHGKLKTSFFTEDWITFFGETIDHAMLVQNYITHVEQNKKECVEWLNDTFPEKEKKKTKEKKQDDKKLESNLFS